MLAYARAHAPGIEFVHGDATALPFDDESFDAVVAAFVLLHLGTPEHAVAEAARVLRPGGRAAFSVWDVPARGRWIGVFFEACWPRERSRRRSCRRARPSSGSRTMRSSGPCSREPVSAT